MSDKPIFYPERNCICAYPEEPILSFYKGYFDSVYIMLNPFEQITSAEEHIKFVSWNEVVNLTGFKDINQLDVALRNSIGGLVREHLNDEDVEILKDTCDRNGLIIPGEGGFSQAHKIDMLRSLLDVGHPHMFVADEFGFERKLHYVQDIINKNGEVELATAHENWYTPKNEILYTVHWDSFYTMLCSDKTTVECIVDKYKFEGFYCNEKTKIYWSLQ